MAKVNQSPAAAKAAAKARSSEAAPAAAATAAVAAPAIKTEGQSRSAKYVIVGCKLPNGLELQLCRKTEYFEDTPSGARQRVKYDKFGPTVVVAGTAYPAGPAPRGFPERPMIIGGYAMTRNVDKEFFDEWMRQNLNNDIVRNKMIMGFPQMDDIRGEALEHKHLRSGFEPLQLDSNGELNDPRVRKTATPGIIGFGTADEMKARIGNAPDAYAEADLG